MVSGGPESSLVSQSTTPVGVPIATISSSVSQSLATTVFGIPIETSTFSSIAFTLTSLAPTSAAATVTSKKLNVGAIVGGVVGGVVFIGVIIAASAFTVLRYHKRVAPTPSTNTAPETSMMNGPGIG